MGQNGRSNNHRTIADPRASSDGKLHKILCLEGEAPGWFLIMCRCGFSDTAKFGQPQAQYIAETHLWKAGQPLRKAAL